MGALILAICFQGFQKILANIEAGMMFIKKKE